MQEIIETLHKNPKITDLFRIAIKCDEQQIRFATELLSLLKEERTK